MYCRRCGNELPNGAAFCPQCGNETGITVAKEDLLPRPINGKTLKIVLVCVFLLALVILIVCVSRGHDSLYGTWTLIDGEFELDGYHSYIEIREGDAGTIEFMKNGIYIFSGPSYSKLFGSSESAYSGSYQILNETTLVMDCDGYSNTMTYSIQDGRLTLENSNGRGIFKE